MYLEPDVYNIALENRLSQRLRAQVFSDIDPQALPSSGISASSAVQGKICSRVAHISRSPSMASRPGTG